MVVFRTTLFFVFYMINFALQGKALAAVQGPMATPFYRNLQSPFASGQAQRQELESRLKSQEFHHSLKVSWNKKDFHLEGHQIIQEIHCVEKGVLTENTSLLESRQDTSKALGLLSKDQSVEILNIQGYWAQVREPFRNTIGWIPQASLSPKSDDLGVFINLIDTFLRKKPSHESSMITTVPKAQRLKIVGYDNGFLKTQYLNYEGYVDLSHLISRADFAVWALKNKKWVNAHHREDQFLVTNDGTKIPLDELSAYAGNPNKGVVINAEGAEPPVRAHIQILERESHQWALSQMPGHGLVWWKKESLLNSKKIIPLTTVLTAEEILKKEIFSVALEGSKKVKGLISAKGIYKTENGETWTYLPQFGTQDLPVSVHPDGVWFVGSFKSSDRGKTFEPFIRWDQLAGLIDSHLGKHPKHIRLQKFESLPKGQLQVFVDAGSARMTLRYNLLSSAWSVVK